MSFLHLISALKSFFIVLSLKSMHPIVLCYITITEINAPYCFNPLKKYLKIRRIASTMTNLRLH
jgi:hypothetical protein